MTPTKSPACNLASAAREGCGRSESRTSARMVVGRYRFIRGFPAFGMDATRLPHGKTDPSRATQHVLPNSTGRVQLCCPDRGLGASPKSSVCGELGRGAQATENPLTWSLQGTI